MDSSFQAATTPRQSNLIVPEDEALDNLPLTAGEGEARPSVNLTSAPAEQSQAVAAPSGAASAMAIQPDAEDLPELPNGNNHTPAASPGQSLGPEETSQVIHPPLLARPAVDAGMAIVRRDDPRREFAECVKQRNYVDAMAAVVGQLCYLEIVTIVEDEDEAQSASESSQDQGLPGHRMVTRMDMAAGDITKIIGKRFIENPDYKPIQDLHQRQVAEGLDVIKNNIQILMNAINSLKNLAGNS
jgi:hypothetical protein